MIQRIQSLFLLLASAGFWSLFMLPLSNSSSSFGDIYANKTLDLQDNIGLLALAVTGGILALVAIFLFRNRKLQVSIGYLVLFLCLTLVGMAYWIYSNNIPASNDASVSLGIGFFLPLVSLVMTVLATIFIQKDERLVKSMDRLR